MHVLDSRMARPTIRKLLAYFTLPGITAVSGEPHDAILQVLNLALSYCICNYLTLDRTARYSAATSTTNLAGKASLGSR